MVLLQFEEAGALLNGLITDRSQVPLCDGHIIIGL
jgi:hypothetical protein